MLTSVGGRLEQRCPAVDEVDLALYLNALTSWSPRSSSGTCLDQRPARPPARPAPQESFFGSLQARASPSPATPRWSAAWSWASSARFAAGGVVIATGQAFASALGGGDAAFGLLFGALFIGLGLGIALGPSVVRDLARGAGSA